MPESPTALLSIRDLAVEFRLREQGTVQAVNGVSFDVPAGGTVALVGESGSGKSVIAQAVLGILPASAHVTAGRILFADPARPSGEPPRDLVRLDPDSAEYRALRGGRISIIFQEPMTSLSAPAHRGGSDRGGTSPAPPRLLPERGARGGPRDAGSGPVSGSRGGPRHLSLPALRRAPPARDDRDGPRLPARPARRGRADHRPRRHRAGAHPEAHARPSGGARHGAPPHHPRSRGGGEPRGRGGGGLPRPADGAGRDRGPVPRPASSLSQGVDAGRAAHGDGPRRAPDPAPKRRRARAGEPARRPPRDGLEASSGGRRRRRRGPRGRRWGR